MTTRSREPRSADSRLSLSRPGLVPDRGIGNTDMRPAHDLDHRPAAGVHSEPATACGPAVAPDHVPTVRLDRPMSAGGPVAVRVPGFDVGPVLGRGGMGVVHQARRLSTGDFVALKTVPDEAVDPSAGTRLLREAERADRVRHPNVVRVLDSGRSGGRSFVAMELCPAGSLADRLTNGPLAPVVAAELLTRLAEGVAAVHAAGLVHGDVKPANVVFAADGTPKLTDFGLAAPAGAAGDPAGTPEYMAPERSRGLPVGPAADVWSLGVVLYECLTGISPFRGGSLLTVLRNAAKTEPRPLREVAPEVPAALRRVCRKCLEKDPARRYPDAAALAAALRRAARVSRRRAFSFECADAAAVG